MRERRMLLVIFYRPTKAFLYTRKTYKKILLIFYCCSSRLAERRRRRWRTLDRSLKNYSLSEKALYPSWADYALLTQYTEHVIFTFIYIKKTFFPEKLLNNSFIFCDFILYFSLNQKIKLKRDIFCCLSNCEEITKDIECWTILKGVT